MKVGDAIRCTNEGCGRPARPEGIYCDECDLERMLYRRDLREGSESGSGRLPEELQARLGQRQAGPGPF